MGRKSARNRGSTQAAAPIALDPRSEPRNDNVGNHRLSMHAFLSSFTAALLFIHAVFGCCWHHAHGGNHGQRAALSESATCCPHHSHDGCSNDECPCQCESDCEGICSYTPAQKIVIEAPQASAPHYVLSAVAFTGCDLRFAAGPIELGGKLCEPAPPLRAHLLNQVFLI
jgi:hypothetical protein